MKTNDLVIIILISASTKVIVRDFTETGDIICLLFPA
jgi:hypothetical protein